MAEEPEVPETDVHPSQLEEVDCVHIVVEEWVILDMLRAVAAGGDPEMVYAEFWANSSVEQVIEIVEKCDCCTCDEEPELCECECSCEDGEDIAPC